MSESAKHKVIAIDGPAGAGKTTQSRLLAEVLGYHYIDTGAFYRALAVGVKNQTVSLDALDKVELSAIFPDVAAGEKSEQQMFVNGENVTPYLRTEEISRLASDVSANPAVRALVNKQLRATRDNYNIVMEGRDIGSAVFPDADVKIYLDATDTNRAKRRQAQLEAAGETVDYEELLRSIRERDYNDSHREHDPLKPADGAIYVLSDANIQETHEALLDLVKQI